MRKSLVVTIPAETINLISLSDAKERLGISDNSGDLRISSFIEQASAVIAAATRRVLVEETVKEKFILDHPSELLVLTRWPVTQIVSVQACGVTISPERYSCDGETAMLIRSDAGSGLSPWPRGVIEVTYVAGYAPDKIPGDIQAAVVSMVQHAMSAASRDPYAKRIEIPDVQTIDYWVGAVGSDGLPGNVVAFLAPHKSPGVS